MDPDQRANIRTALAAFKRHPESARFRERLNLARQRLDRNSTVDIRGCHAGSDPNYLRAVAALLGNGTSTPHVSGPDRFQGFPRLRSISLRTGTEVAALASRPDVAEALDHWARVTRRPQFAQQLLGYLDGFVLPVASRDPVTDLHTGGVAALVLGDRLPGSSGFVAIRDFVDSLWRQPPASVTTKMRELRSRWSRQNQGVPVAVLSVALDDSDPAQQSVISPDAEYDQHIIQV